MSLIEAIAAGDKKKVKALLDGGNADVKEKDKHGKTVLIWLADEMRDLALAERVIDAGCPIDAIDDRDIEGYSALHIAVTPPSGSEKGADPMAVDDNKATPLHLASGSGSLVMIEALVARGAKVTRDAQGSTPLFYCLSTHDKDTKLWDRLIALGCGIDDQNDSKTTPIMEAQVCWNPAGVKHFIAKGANLGLKDDEGKTVLERARDLKQAKIIPLLEKALEK